MAAQGGAVMGMLFHRTISHGGRRARASAAGEFLRFYGVYFRWPVALLVLAGAGAELIYHAALPLGGLVRREWAYHEAKQAWDEGRNAEALYRIREALLDTRDDARFWELAARISDRLDSPEAPYCWQQADRLRPGRVETHFALVESALVHGPPELAAWALREIPADEQERLRYLVDAGRLARAEGDEIRAGFFFEQAEALRPVDAPTLFTLADWHAAEGNSGRARALLENLAARRTERAEALRKLVDLHSAQRDFVAARADEAALLALPEATFPDELRQLDLAPDAAQVESLLTVLLRHASRKDAARVLDWMSWHGRAEAALVWIRRRDEAWQEDPVIGMARAACLKELGEWEHLRDDQRDSTWPGHEAMRLMLLAQGSLALGQADEARAAWHRAVAACEEHADFMALAEAAEAFHDGGEEKAEVWVALANRFPDQQWPLRSLLDFELRRGDLPAAQGLAERLAILAPDDVEIRATSDLLGLLRGSALPQAQRDLASLESRQPGDAAVATAAAYALYLQGRFGEALATVGALEPAELRAPERAPYLGQMLAAIGPPEEAETTLRGALAQPELLPGQEQDIRRALDLATTRRLVGDLLHPRDAGARARARAYFLARLPTGLAPFLIGAAVAETDDPRASAAILARVDVTTLNRPELVLDEGAVLALSRPLAQAEPYLVISPDLPVEQPRATWHRIVEAWWTLEKRMPSDPSMTSGLLGAYQGLESAEPDPAFWRGDESRELALARTVLQAGQEPGDIQRRLEALLGHVPSTPELEAEIGYALFLQGRVEAGRERLEVLSTADLARPEPARYYAAILCACGEIRRGAAYSLIANREIPGEKAR